jgi:hypothetical protein
MTICDFFCYLNLKKNLKGKDLTLKQLNTVQWSRCCRLLQNSPRDASDIGRGSGKSVHMLKEPALKGITLPSFKHNIFVFTDSVLIHLTIHLQILFFKQWCLCHKVKNCITWNIIKTKTFLGLCTKQTKSIGEQNFVFVFVSTIILMYRM